MSTFQAFTFPENVTTALVSTVQQQIEMQLDSLISS